MKLSKTFTTLLLTVIALTATSCYTQLKSTYSDGYYHRPDRSEVDKRVSGERSLQQREEQIVNEEDYLTGYEDGWEDSEAYYFKDYETKRWYEEYGASLAHDPYARRVITHNYYYPYHGSHYSPYHYRYADPYYPYRSYSSWRWHMTFGIHFGYGWHWNWYKPHYAYYDYYDFYAYPHYYPFYGHLWGYGHPYGNIFVINYGDQRRVRKYGPRGNGLVSGGADNIRRTRADARVRSEVNRTNRSDIRSRARSSQVRRSNGTVSRNRGNTRTSTVRNRSADRSTNRGTVNRRSGSNSNRGTVNRSRSSSNNRGSVSRSRSSSSNRGSVNRSRSSSSNRGSVNRSRSSSRERSDPDQPKEE